MTGALQREVEAHFAGRIVASREGIAETAFYLAHDFLGEPLFHRLATNSYSMASTSVGAQRYMKLFAYLPAALHPRIESAALLCFGVGATASALADLPELRSLDVVDVSRDILEMSDVVHPDPRRHPLRDPRVAVHVEDARFFLQHTAKRYDLITGEPPPPKIAGVTALYTREHFALVRERLNPGGIATYWLPAHLLHEREALAIARAFCEAFADCSLWSGVNLDWILVGSRDGLAPVPRERFARLFALAGAGAELRRLGFDGPGQLVAQFMADAGTLRALAADTPPLVDDFPRRVGPRVSAEPATPRYAELMSAVRGRERLAASAWAARVLPPELIAESRDGFRRREILEASLYPALRRPGYDYWADMAELLRPGSAELPRWALGSGARAAEIAARAGSGDALAAEHVAIDALAMRRKPVAPAPERFAAMTVRGQVVTMFHHCVAGERASAAAMAGWISRERRAAEPYRSSSTGRRGNAGSRQAHPDPDRCLAPISAVGRRPAFAPERVGELPEVGLGRLEVDCAVALRPVVGLVRGAEQQVPQRQEAGEVLVEALFVRSVVPVVVLRRGDHPAQVREAPAHVGVDENRVE